MRKRILFKGFIREQGLYSRERTLFYRTLFERALFERAGFIREGGFYLRGSTYSKRRVLLEGFV